MSRKTILGYNYNQTTQEPIALDTQGTFLVDPVTFSPLVLPARWGIKEIRIKNAGQSLFASVTGTTKLIIYLGEVGQPNIDIMEVPLASLNIGTNVSLVGTDNSLITDILHYQKDLMIRTDTGSVLPNGPNGSIVSVQFKMCAANGAPGGNPPTHILANMSAPDAQCLNLQNGQTHTITGEELSGVTSLDWYAISDPVNAAFQVGGRVVYDPVTFDTYELVKNDYGTPLTIRSGSTLRVYATLNDPDKNGYLIKRDTTGIVQWISRIYDADSTPDYQWHRVAYDSLNSTVQIGGAYTGPLTLYNSDDTVGLVLPAPTNNQGVFTAKYSNTGQVLWAARMDTDSVITPGNEPKGMDLRVDSLTGEVVFGTNWKLANANTVSIYDSFGVLTATYNEGSTLNPATPDIIVKYASNGAIIWTILNPTLGAASAADCYGDLALHQNSGSVYWHVKLSPVCDYAIYNSDGSLVTTILGASNSNHLLIRYDSAGFYQWHTLSQYAPPTANGDGRIECDQISGLVYGIYDIPVSVLGTTVTFQQSDTTLVKPIIIDGLAKNVLVCWDQSGILIWRAKYGMGYTGVPIGTFATSPHSITTNPTTGDIYFTVSTTINTATGVTLEFNDLNDTLVLNETPSGGITKFLVKYSKFGVPKWIMRTRGQYLGINYDGAIDSRCGNKIVYNAEYQTGSKTYNSDSQMIVHSSVVTGTGQIVMQIQDNEEYSVNVNNVLTEFPSIVYTAQVPTVLCFKDPAVPFTRATMEANGYFELKWNGLTFDLQKDHWVLFT